MNNTVVSRYHNNNFNIILITDQHNNLALKININRHIIGLTKLDLSEFFNRRFL